MTAPDRRGVFVLFLFACFFCLVLLAQLARLGQAWGRFSAAGRTLEERGAQLTRLALEQTEKTRRARELSRQIGFLQDLPSLLPEQARFLRTQNVLQEEVGVLRRDVAKRLAGSLYVLVDTKTNKLYVKKGMKVLLEADCSVGRGGVLRDKTGRGWDFSTPKGIFSVTWKTLDPVWIKPDWAFVESRQPVPPQDDPARMVQGELGKYLLSIGHGYLIHGTKDEKSLGRPASHGCIRLGAADLEQVYKLAPVGTKVYVY